MLFYYWKRLLLGRGSSVGNIAQRFPKYDWSDISLSPSLEVVCYSLSENRIVPEFFLSLYDIPKSGIKEIVLL